MNGPSSLSRRDIFRTAAALGVGGTALALSTPALAADPLPFATESGLVTGKPKKLKYEEIPGLLTKAQVAPHYNAHYGGALKRFVAIEEQMDKLFAGKEPAAGDAHVFAVKDRVNKMNSVLLHELYFDGLVPKPPEPDKDLRAEIGKRFGSFERWIEDFQTCCMAAAGWGILARDAVNGKLYNVASDLHEVGVIWLGQPLVVCDVYEHAFYVDYQNKKADYVKKFVDFIDWEEIARRWTALTKGA
ncbi:MAG: Fe-Mn family superoxide dismutase [Planctomycetia bacterium]|nr:Fe-Mn family superoxide dismutase [Planctomycetia bacterium]